MRIARFQFNMLPVNTYVLWDTASRECAIVDAGCYYPKEEETLAEFIDDNKLTVKYLLATHLHFTVSVILSWQKNMELYYVQRKPTNFSYKIWYANANLLVFRFEEKYSRLGIIFPIKTHLTSVSKN
jgi:hypothetical protein